MRHCGCSRSSPRWEDGQDQYRNSVISLAWEPTAEWRLERGISRETVRFGNDGHVSLQRNGGPECIPGEPCNVVWAWFV